MSTRSTISIQLENDLYKTIYCHHDGYLTHNGALLLDHYNSREKVEKLLELGDLSCLASQINPDPTKPHSFEYDQRQYGVCVAYGRDRGESNVEAKVMSLKELFEETWIEYFYIFTKDNKWKYYDCNKDKIKDVQEELAKEYEQLGIKRPENFYGFWTKDSLAQEKKRQQKTQVEM